MPLISEADVPNRNPVLYKRYADIINLIGAKAMEAIGFEKPLHVFDTGTVDVLNFGA